MNEILRIFNLHGVRYQVTDVARAAAFYTDRFGFTLEHQQLPAFASVSLGDFVLLSARHARLDVRLSAVVHRI